MALVAFLLLSRGIKAKKASQVDLKSIRGLNEGPILTAYDIIFALIFSVLLS